MIRNPYTVGTVINHDNSFVGRTKEIQTILAAIQSYESIALYGQRRIGKSSVLSKLEKELKQKKKYQPVKLDLQGKFGYKLDDLVKVLAKAIQRTCKLKNIPLELEEPPVKWFEEKWLPDVQEQLESMNLRGIVLLLDEFDAIDNDGESRNAYKFYNYLGHLLEKKKLKVIVVLGRDPDELPDLAKFVLKNSKRMHISLMSESETNKLIDLSRKVLKWSPAARKEVWLLTKGHPLITQSLCYKVFEENSEAIEKGVRPVVLIEQIEKAFSFREYGHIIEHAWNRLGREEKLIVCYISNQRRKLRDQDIVEFIDSQSLSDFFHENPLHMVFEKLRAKEWIDYKSGVVEIKVSIYKQWVEQKFALSILIKDLFDFQAKAFELLLQAKKINNVPQSIQLLERSIEHDSENPEISVLLVNKLETMIDACLENNNTNLAKKYIDKLSKYDRRLSRFYDERVRSNIRVDLTLQKINLYTQNNRYLEAHETLKSIEAYDPSLTQKFRREVLYHQLMFVINDGLTNTFLGSPLWFTVSTLPQYTQTVSGALLFSYTVIYLFLLFVAAYFKSVSEQIGRIISLTIPYFIGLILVFIELNMILEKDAVKTLVLIIILLFSTFLALLAPTDKISKGFGIMIINMILVAMFLTGGVVIPPPSDQAGLDIVKAIKNPPDNSTLLWQTMEKFVEWLSRR
jgi:hypothetical protein